MQKLLFIALVLQLAGCKQGVFESIDIQLDKEKLNLVQERGVSANMKVFAYYSDGSRKELKTSEYVAFTKTVNASGGIEMITIEGDKIIPKEGGVGEVSALYINDRKTFITSKKVVVRPFYRD